MVSTKAALIVGMIFQLKNLTFYDVKNEMGLEYEGFVGVDDLDNGVGGGSMLRLIMIRNCSVVQT